MTDIASYIQSDWSWAILFVTALFVGISKTGIQGLTLLTVPLLAMAFGAKPSTGLIAPDGRLPGMTIISAELFPQIGAHTI